MKIYKIYKKLMNPNEFIKTFVIFFQIEYKRNK